jgi:hypothetical protein
MPPRISVSSNNSLGNTAAKVPADQSRHRSLESTEVYDVATATKNSHSTKRVLTGMVGGSMQVLEKSGERGRNRTYNLLIKSQLLCQLSYAPLLTQGENETELYHLVCSTQIGGIETQSRGR